MRINTGLRMVARSEGSVQIGLGAGGVILDGLSVPDRRFIDALERGFGDEELPDVAGACSIPPSRVQELLASLRGVLFEGTPATHAHGLRSDRLSPDAAHWSGTYLRDAWPMMDSRSRSVVRVGGLGRTGAAIAQGLAAAGVGTLLLDDSQPVVTADIGTGAFRISDVGLRRSAAVKKQIALLDPACNVYALRPDAGPAMDYFAIDLVLYVGHDVVPGQVSAELMSKDHPHLVVLLREQDSTVGPLVLPGETACIDCVERHRAAADDQWTLVSDQLAATAISVGRPEESSLALATAGMALMQSLLFLDGLHEPASWSSVTRIRMADGSSTRQSYRPHPDCGCQLQAVGSTAHEPGEA